jgi:hypothetical protein
MRSDAIVGIERISKGIDKILVYGINNQFKGSFGLILREAV